MLLMLAAHAAVPVEQIEIRPGRTVALHRRESRQRSNKTIIFVHGSAASVLQWREQIELFASAGYHVVAYDAVGCGRSPAPVGWEVYSTEALYDDLKAVVARYGSSGSIVLAGHSAGCSHVCRFAAEAAGTPDPNCVSTLPKPATAPAAVVLLAPISSLPGALGIFKLPVFVLELIRPMLSSGFAERAFHARTREASTDAHRDLVQLSVETSGRNAMHMCKAYYRQLQVPSIEVFAACATPTLLVNGEADGITPADMHARPLQQLITGAAREVVLVPSTSHQVMQEQPEQVHSAILAFLADLQKEALW